MQKIIKKGDIFLLISFIAAAILIACIPVLRRNLQRNGTGSQSNAGSEDNSMNSVAGSGAGGSGISGDIVVITIAGTRYGTWPLSEDRTIDIDNSYGFNEVTIQDGAVSVTKSDCANQICVDTGTIGTQGQMILCLPHRLSIEIQAAEPSDQEYDAIVH